MSVDTTRLTTVLADRYRLEREFGRGGMAMVQLAQVAHGETVAAGEKRKGPTPTKWPRTFELPLLAQTATS